MLHEVALAWYRIILSKTIVVGGAVNLVVLAIMPLEPLDSLRYGESTLVEEDRLNAHYYICTSGSSPL